VLAAVLIVSLVFGLLLESVTHNLADLGRARLEARGTQLAEQRLRELEVELAAGIAVELGVSEGAYEPPDDDLRWHITVSAKTLDLPADYPGKVSPSALFALPGATGSVATPLAPGAVPPLRLVEIRVFPADIKPENVDPFVYLITAPPDPGRLQQLKQQPLENPQATDRTHEGQPQ
jgi:hypothetical protein